MTHSHPEPDNPPTHPNTNQRFGLSSEPPPPFGPPPPSTHLGPSRSAAPVSEKSFVAAWLFAWFLGFLGVDRFYLGKIGTGVLKLVSLAGFGIWWLIDVIVVLTGKATDHSGKHLSGYRKHRTMALAWTAGFIAMGLIGGGIASSQTGSDEIATPTAENKRAVDDTPADAATEAEDAENSTVDEPSVEPLDESVDADSWADDRYGTFEEMNETGSGDSILALPTGATAGLVVASHTGSSNFVVEVLDESNQSTGDLLVNEIGSYEGTTAFGINAFGDGSSLQVTADGAWSIDIVPISAAPDLESQGTGDAAFIYTGPPAQLRAAHDGDSNFVVYEATDTFSMGLLINEIGTYEGTVPLSEGPSLVTVNADGQWSLTTD